MKLTITVCRDAITGRFITEEDARRRKKTTIVQKIKIPSKRRRR